MPKHPLTAVRDRSALVILDLQGRLLETVLDRDTVTAAAALTARLAGIVKVPVLITEQNSKSLGHTLPQIRVAAPGARVIDKMAFSAFGDATFARTLADLGRSHLVVCGIMTHVCVCQTVLDAVAAGHTVHVVADAVSCGTLTDHHAGLDKMRQAGAVITSAELVAYEWLERAGTDEFRAALPWLKKKEVAPAPLPAHPASG